MVEKERRAARGGNNLQSIPRKCDRPAEDRGAGDGFGNFLPPRVTRKRMPKSILSKNPHQNFAK